MRLLNREAPKGIAVSEVLLALANLASSMGAYRLARFAYGRLQVCQRLTINNDAVLLHRLALAATHTR